MRLTKSRVNAILAAISIFAAVVGIPIIMLSVIREESEVSAIERRYVLTTLTSYPENLRDFGMVLRIGEGLAEKVLSSTTMIYSGAGGPLNATFFIAVGDVRVTEEGLSFKTKLRTACLGNITPTCLVKAQLGEPVVVLGSEEVGYIETAMPDIPELRSLIIEANGVDEERVKMIANKLILSYHAMVLIFVFLYIVGLYFVSPLSEAD